MTADLPASGHRQLWEDRDPQGRLLASAVLGAAGIEGPLRRFGSDGRPTFEADFHDGRLHGVLRAYDDKGALELEARYRHGLREGLARTFSGGRCVAEQVYVAGLPSGPLTTYDDLGRTTRSASFVDGRLDGVVRDFHEGRLVREAVWRSGALEGEVREFDVRGRLVRSEGYRGNRLHGPMRSYGPDGRVVHETVYRDGVALREPGGVAGASETDGGLAGRLRQWLRGDLP